MNFVDLQVFFRIFARATAARVVAEVAVQNVTISAAQSNHKTCRGKRYKFAPVDEGNTHCDDFTAHGDAVAPVRLRDLVAESEDVADAVGVEETLLVVVIPVFQALFSA